MEREESQQRTEKEIITEEGDRNEPETPRYSSVTPPPLQGKTETKPKGQPPSLHSDPTALNDLTDALASLCGTKLEMVSARKKIEVKTTASKLFQANVTPDALGNFGRWWFANDWRGKRGDKPTPLQVGDEWGKFENWKNGGTTNGHRNSSPNLDDPIERYITDHNLDPASAANYRRNKAAYAKYDRH